MTDKTMTQVLDEIDDCAEGRSLMPMRSELKGWHDVITAHLAQTAGRVHAGEPRFFIDHTMIHDRVTGKHVTCEPDFRDYVINPGETTRINNPDGISNTCALLNSLVAADISIVREVIEWHRAQEKTILESEDYIEGLTERFAERHTKQADKLARAIGDKP